MRKMLRLKWDNRIISLVFDKDFANILIQSFSAYIVQINF